MNNEAALNEYIRLQGEILSQLEFLKERLEENHGVLPEEIHYGHVGDLAHINKILENLINPI
jgi:hypothetical protein